MNTKILTQFPLPRLVLKDDFSFDDYLCLITGKNGTGKTRLLNALPTLMFRVEIDGKQIEPQNIELLDINQYNGNLLSPTGNNKTAQIASEIIIKEISKYDNSDDLPTSSFGSRDPQSTENIPKLNLKEIIKYCESIFNKDISRLSSRELELSLNISNGLLNSLTTGTFDESVSLSQLTINYYNAIDLNDFLEFQNSKGKDVSYIEKSNLFKHIGEESPHKKFNSILEGLFRGKFKVSDPDPRLQKEHYAPKILNAVGEEISFDSLSSGEKSIFWMASKIFAAYTTSPNKIFGNVKIVLLDEPDSHLHPQMIIDFYECLKALHESLGLIFIFTSHSPTTAALLPSKNIFSLIEDGVADYSLIRISKDGAISQLLEGVSQLSINPENSRQVFVENGNDSYIYDTIYSFIRNKSKIIDQNINLTFTSSGPKLQEGEIIKHVLNVYGDDELSRLLIDKLNGTGNCEQVIGQVGELKKKGNVTVRGLIDWDKQERKHGNDIVVFAHNSAYSIENIVYDPLCIAVYLAIEGVKTSLELFNNSEIWHSNLSNKDNLQHAVDVITKEVLNRHNNKNYEIKYIGGLTLLGDREYFIPENGNGHDFEKLILGKFAIIKKLLQPSSGRPLIYFFTKKITLGTLGWEFININFEEAFHKLQK